jgi:hypothetical protein
MIQMLSPMGVSDLLVSFQKLIEPALSKEHSSSRQTTTDWGYTRHSAVDKIREMRLRDP